MILGIIYRFLEFASPDWGKRIEPGEKVFPDRNFLFGPFVFSLLKIEVAYAAAVSSSTAAIMPVSVDRTEASLLSSRTEKYRDSKGSSGESFGFPEGCFDSGRSDGFPLFPLFLRLPGSVSADGSEFADESDAEEAEPASWLDGSG